MSDDDDYGEPDDLGTETDEGDLSLEDAVKDPDTDEGPDEEPLEDAAGTEEEDEDEDEEEGPDEEEVFTPGGGAAKAVPSRARVDPILRASNKHIVVHIVPSGERLTDNRLQKTEAAYLIAMRAEQISKHATAFVDAKGLHDPVAIAFKELFERRTPLKLRRLVGTGPTGETIVEEWNVREMVLPPLTPPVPLGGTSTAGGAPPGRW